MTKHNKEIKDRAFQLYAQGIPKERIAKQLGISKITLYRWIERYNWEEEKRKIDERVGKLLNESVTELKERQLKVIRAITARYIRDLQDESKPFKHYPDIISLMKHELHLRGEAETSTKVSLFEELRKEVEKLKNVKRRQSKMGKSKKKD
jgi:uncharacterized protein YjcR